MSRQFCLIWCVVAAFAVSTGALAAGQLTPQRNLRLMHRTLYRFKGATDGAHPQAGLVMDSKGNLYGTTSGLFSGTDCGTVFEISRATRAESVLHAFSCGGRDGANPTSSLSIDGAGNLYGTTEYGGTGCTSSYLDGCGTVFEVAARTRALCTARCGTRFARIAQIHPEAIIQSFFTAGGWAPDGGVLLEHTGTLFGTTSSGSCGNGTFGCGTVFEIVAGGRSRITLHTFWRGSGIDGFPKGRLLMGRGGNLYGTAWNDGGRHHVYGTVFEVMVATGKARILHTFTGGLDGDMPNGGLVMDAKGNLFGTTQLGGRGCEGSISDYVIGCGSVFEIAAGTHRERILYRFKGGADGAEPQGGLIIDRAGNLYGTTSSGGKDCRAGCGTVFEITAHGHKERTLYRFKGARAGAGPMGRLLMGKSGNIYGTTFGGGRDCRKPGDLGPGCGTVFELIRR
jgi:uncharacterized repeat protein (TIGR03803 family)